VARREDRVAHGALYTVSGSPQTGPGGDILTLDRAVTAPPGAEGLVVRRWDGQAVGATSARNATFRGNDLGVTFSAGTGSFVVGDWWGARLREEENPGIEERTDAAPDGSPHVFTPLALVDLGARSVLHDCRPTFVPLTLLATGCCTVSVKPGDDLQDALDRLPADGGELCMAAGVYPLDTPLQVKGRKRIVINGAGAATIIRATKTEAAVVIDSSNEIELHDLRVEGGSPGGAGDPHLNGAITASLVVGLTIADCSLACPGARGIRMQTCVTARAPAVDVRIERNSFEVGPWQTGILLLDVESALVAGNRLGLPPDVPDPAPGSTDELVTRMMRRLMGAAIAPPGPGVVEVAVPGAGQLTMTGGTEGAR